MVHAARPSTASARAPLSPRHFLIGHAPIKNARNSPESNALNFSNRLKTRCFSGRSARVFRSKYHHSPVTRRASLVANHPSPRTNHAFLIASRQILKIELTPSQQTRKYFLIASFSASLAPAPHLTSLDPRRTAQFLFDTNKPHKIIILMSALLKTKEKQSSIRYKFALRSNPHRRALARPRFSHRPRFMYSAGPMLDL